MLTLSSSQAVIEGHTGHRKRDLWYQAILDNKVRDRETQGVTGDAKLGVKGYATLRQLHVESEVV